MPLFAQQPFYTVPSDDFGNFGGLVRFIDDWEKHMSQKNARKCPAQPRPVRRSVPDFTPRFDVRETEQGYELHGELAGVEKKDVNIEFSDIQTIVISGKVERNYTTATPQQPATAANLLTEKDIMSDAVVVVDDEDARSDSSVDTRSTKSFQATVEDEEEEGAEKDADTNVNAAATESSTQPDDAEKKKNSVVEPRQQQQKHRYWVRERSVGNFSRSFAFPARVDHDGVVASLDNGILTVVVPKAKKPESRRIAIF